MLQKLNKAKNSMQLCFTDKKSTITYLREKDLTSLISKLCFRVWSSLSVNIVLHAS